jgi:K+/H+ antiporter YhaU regulatory subunit KhtT
MTRQETVHMNRDLSDLYIEACVLYAAAQGAGVALSLGEEDTRTALGLTVAAGRVVRGIGRLSGNESSVDGNE